MEEDVQKLTSVDMIDRALEASGQILWRISQDGFVRECQGAVQRILGAPPEDFAGRTVASIVAPVDRDRTARILQRLFETGRPERDYPMTLLKRDGSGVEMRAGGVLANADESGEPLVVAITFDVTAEMVAKRDLEIRRLRFSEAFQVAPVGVLLVHLDPDRGAFVVRANDEACRIADATPEVLEKSWLRKSGRVHVEGQEIIEARDLTLALQAGEIRTFNIDRSITRRDGERRIVRTQVAALDSGLWKSIDGKYPVNATIHIEDITPQVDAQEKLQFLASHDSMTGLLNRKFFVESLDYYMSGRRERDGTGALFGLDLDDFKVVNDSWGHHVGDGVLTQVARLLDSNLRDGDVVARLGGDEFAILIPGVNSEDAARIADKLVSSLNESDLPVAAATREGFHPKASVGVLMLDQKVREADQALQLCDRLMYEAKRDGGGRYVLRSALDLVP